MKRKIFTFLLSGMMLMGMMPATALADTAHTHSVEGQDNGSNVTWTEISSLSEINSDGSYYLTQPVVLDTTWECNYNVNLCLNGNSITCSTDGDVIVIEYGKTFALTDCQNNAGNITHSEGLTGRGIYNKGSFYMYSGNISGNTVTGPQYSNEYGKEYKGGGVYNSGTFYMYNGTISDNSVNVKANADEGNYDYGYDYSRYYSYFNGGGVYNGGIFNMLGGIISDNHADNDYGGGVYNSSIFELSGNAVISSNNARMGGGLYNSGGFNMSGGNIKENHSGGAGGGVLNQTSGTFTMTGGLISGNSTERSGAGVCNWEGKFIMSDNAVISDNASTDTYGGGGGVYNFNGTFTMNGGSINNNKAPRGGGGVENYAENYHKIQFTMNGGTVSGNEAGSLGGGIWHHVYHINSSDNAEGVFIMNGGTVSQNRLTDTSGKGGGVYSNGDMILSGSPNITGNTAANLYLASEKLVSASGLASGVRIGVNKEIVPSGTTPVSITNDTVAENYFVSENSAYETGVNSEGYIVMNLTDPSLIPSYALMVVNGTGSGNYAENTNITITANEPEPGKVFDKWVLTSGDAVIADVNSATTTVTTHISPSVIEAVYKDENSSSDPTPETPTIIEGANGTYTQGGQDGISFRSNDAYSNFQKVLVDGNEIASENYTTREGSIIVTLKPEYLSTLVAGTHSISIVSAGGIASTDFTVQTASTPNPTPTPSEPATSTPSAPTTEATVTPVTQAADESAQNSQTTEVSSPKTAENDFGVALCTTLLMVSCAGLAGMSARRKKNAR